MRRAALLAGRWYPAGARECREAVESCSRGGPDDAAGDHRGLIGPHAGWAYSGECAGKAYRALASSRGGAELAVVFGSHRGPDGPHTVFRGEAWETPLGPLLTSSELATRVARELGLDDEPIRPLRADNAVELHLPFVRHFFARAELLMIGVGASEVALGIGRAVGAMVAERDVVIIGSTDLTHYGPNYAFEPAGEGDRAVRWVREVNDAGFVDAVLADEPRRALEHAVSNGSACCPGAVVAAMEAVRASGAALAPVLVDHRLSCDVRPDTSFVGYASVLL